AEKETRLALIDENEARVAATGSKLILRGVVLRSNELGIPSQVLDALGRQVPNLNKDFVFIYNADWPDQDGLLEMGDSAPYIFCLGLSALLPFIAFRMTAGLWDRRDAALKEECRRALAGVRSPNNFT